MKAFFNYKIDKKKDSYSASIQLKDFIENVVSQNHFQFLLKKYNTITSIPEDVLMNKCKMILFSNFDFHKGLFNRKFSLYMILKDAFLYIWIVLSSIFLSKKNPNKTRFYDVILDDVDQVSAFMRFKKLLNLFNTHLVILDKRMDTSNFQDSNNFYFSKKKLVFDKKYLINKQIMFIKFFFLLIHYSIKYRLNFFLIFNIIFFQTLKYETIFSHIKGKYLITERFWNTCCIKNHIFKKHGGIATSCFQKNIFEASISMFINSDIIFTLGNNKDNIKAISYLGGNSKIYVPVGSIAMEYKWFSLKKDISKIPEIDLLIIGINPSSCLEINDSVKRNYFEHIKWVRDFSLEYPEYKIYLKHHDYRLRYTNNKGKVINKKEKFDNIFSKYDSWFAKEQEILQKTNIITETESASENGSYAYIDKSKVICSFGSTMVLEAIGNRKRSFFLDPNFENSAFFKNYESFKSLRISNYMDFKNKMIELIKKKEADEIVNSDYYCFKSDKVSERIFDYFNNR